MPGFTHPVTDVYLDEILPLIGFQSTGRFKESSGSNRQTPPSLNTEQQARVDEAIFESFLNATEESYDHLLEVSARSLLKLSRDTILHLNSGTDTDTSIRSN